MYDARLAREAAKPEAKVEREEARRAQRAEDPEHQARLEARRAEYAQRAEDPEHQARLEAHRAEYALSRQAAGGSGLAVGSV